jgi:hypothetical protein
MENLNEQLKRIKEMYSFDEAGKQRGKSFTHKSTYNPGTHTCTNKDMSADVYKLRRMVMEYVYRAKKLVGGDFFSMFLTRLIILVFWDGNHLGVDMNDSSSFHEVLLAD